MKKINIFIYIILLLFFGNACKEVFEAPFTTPATGYLVVEGIVNSGEGNTTIKLTRTTRLENRVRQNERGALVQIEGQNNTIYRLTETREGSYTADNLRLDTNLTYRLYIKTKGGNEYASDYVKPVYTPAIDSVTWKLEDIGLQMYVNTFNALNNTRYYQWDYDETWEIQSRYRTNLKYVYFRDRFNQDSVALAFRDSTTLGNDESLFRCWQFNSSFGLILGSSVKLEKDAINLPVALVPNGSEKLNIRYSINVKQYGWSKEGYAFLEKIKKNTEQLGSIFDAQPSELKGNIRSLTNPDEIVVGFLNVCNVTQKRIFITVQDVAGWNYKPFPCMLATVENNRDSIFKKLGFGIPVFSLAVQEPPTYPPEVILFAVAPVECVDCTSRGTNVKPDYWP